jgi:transcriptional regulator with XRE-family HTH domain
MHYRVLMSQNNHYLPHIQELSRLLREYHDRAGLSIRELAALCDVDHSYVSLILQGKRRPARDLLITLAAFGWGLDQMQTDELLLLAGWPPLGRSALREYRKLVTPGQHRPDGVSFRSVEPLSPP